MVLAALASDDEELRQAPYRVLQDWQTFYGGNLLIVLPDTFGDGRFPARCARLDRGLDRLSSGLGSAIEGGEMILDWWRRKNRNPQDKLIVFFRRARR